MHAQVDQWPCCMPCCTCVGVREHAHATDTTEGKTSKTKGKGSTSEDAGPVHHSQSERKTLFPPPSRPGSSPPGLCASCFLALCVCVCVCVRAWRVMREEYVCSGCEWSMDDDTAGSSPWCAALSPGCMCMHRVGAEACACTEREQHHHPEPFCARARSHSLCSSARARTHTVMMHPRVTGY